MLKLYHWEPNANSGKPMLALAEKGVEYESHYLDLLQFDQHQPEYLRVNPDGTIPAMVHDGRVLTESTKRSLARRCGRPIPWRAGACAGGCAFSIPISRRH
jgi:hypothetical protein